MDGQRQELPSAALVQSGNPSSLRTDVAEPLASSHSSCDKQSGQSLFDQPYEQLLNAHPPTAAQALYLSAPSTSSLPLYAQSSQDFVYYPSHQPPSEIVHSGYYNTPVETTNQLYPLAYNSQPMSMATPSSLRYPQAAASRSQDTSYVVASEYTSNHQTPSRPHSVSTSVVVPAAPAAIVPLTSLSRKEPGTPVPDKRKRRCLSWKCCGIVTVLIILIIVAAALVFAFAIFKTPNITVSGFKQSTTRQAMSVSSSTIYLNWDILVDVKNENSFGISFYSIELKGFSDSARTNEVANGTLGDTYINPTAVTELTFPLTMALDTSSVTSTSFVNALVASCTGGRQPVTFYYNVGLGLSLIKVFGFKPTVQQQYSGTCPVDLSNTALKAFMNGTGASTS